MGKTKLILSFAFLALAILPLQAQNLSFEWDRVLMDGHRTSQGAVLSPSAQKEKELLRSCEHDMALLKEVIGYSCEEMSTYRPQSPLGNLVADIIMAQMEKSGTGCDLALTNIGGIRQNLPKGEVIMEDMVGMFPFKNTIVMADIRGDKLLELFNHMAKHQWEIFSGAKVVASGDSVVSMTISGRLLDKTKTYRIAVNSFLFNGGDGICVKELAGNFTDSGVTMLDLVVRYIRDLTAAGGKLHSAEDERLVFADGKDRITGAHEAVSANVHPENGATSFNPNPSVERSTRPKLTILHTNDTHSTMEPLRFGKYAGMAGVVERAAFIDSVRKADGKSNVLVLDAGDYSQGTPYFSTFGGKVEVDAMNIMGYDVATIGNHEWDNGAVALGARLHKAGWATTLCNYVVEEKSLEKELRPYVIVRRGGLKVGIIGVLANITEVTDRTLVKGMSYVSPAEPINRWAEFLKKKKGCDLVIVLSHCGLESRYVNDMGDMDFSPKLKNVDIVIGGHTHTDLNAPKYVNGADGRPVMIVTDYCMGIYVGQIHCYR